GTICLRNTCSWRIKVPTARSPEITFVRCVIDLIGQTSGGATGVEGPSRQEAAGSPARQAGHGPPTGRVIAVLILAAPRWNKKVVTWSRSAAIPVGTENLLVLDRHHGLPEHPGLREVILLNARRRIPWLEEVRAAPTGQSTLRIAVRGMSVLLGGGFGIGARGSSTRVPADRSRDNRRPGTFAVVVRRLRSRWVSS